jgi:sugar/nucleoside kinase (ribokinase family)
MRKPKGSSRKGVLAGGNWIIDQVKMVDVYPQREQLANIRSESQGTGGAPFNVLVDLARLKAPFPLSAAGLVGKDALGSEILEICKKQKIDTKLLKTAPAASTSYTDVMTEIGNGRRTFFHHRGANALWDGKELNFAKTKARIFHLGYLLLLDALDASDSSFGTKAARLLGKAQEAGMKTSVDVVSEDSDRFSKIAARMRENSIRSQ